MCYLLSVMSSKRPRYFPRSINLRHEVIFSQEFCFRILPDRLLLLQWCWSGKTLFGLFGASSGSSTSGTNAVFRLLLQTSFCSPSVLLRLNPSVGAVGPSNSQQWAVPKFSPHGEIILWTRRMSLKICCGQLPVSIEGQGVMVSRWNRIHLKHSLNWMDVCWNWGAIKNESKSLDRFSNIETHGFNYRDHHGSPILWNPTFKNNWMNWNLTRQSPLPYVPSWRSASALARPS